MTPFTFDKRRLKKLFYQRARELHPDSSNGKADPANVERFRQMLTAYEVLKNDASRREWDIQHWQRRYEDRSSAASDPSDYERYQRDDFDYYGFSSNQSRNFDDDLYANKIWLLKLVSGTAVVVMLGELYIAQKASEAHEEMMEQKTMANAALLAQARSNHGQGWNAEDRITRFLEHRQSAIDAFEHFSYSNFTKASSAGTPSDDQ